MNRRTIWAIARKDLAEIGQEKAVWLPMIIVPVIFVVLIPVLMLILPSLAPARETNQFSPAVFKQMLAHMPTDLAAQLREMPQVKSLGIVFAGYMFAPMFLIIPLMMATIIGTNAFVGEKERKTLEALLYSPATDAELFTGKVLAALLPAITLSWVSFAVYTVVVNAAAWPIMGRVWFPTATWWPLMFWVAPAIATLGLSVAVLVSAKARTFMEANQLSGILVLPVIGMMAGQITGALFLSTPLAFVLGAILWIVDLLLIVVAIRTFARAELITRL
ncbi:MAG: ABC transporter permease subunit [Candidatus Sericytochromatia bacterium]|nr:ABC transporter permease subunit [Candidatus Sericytochromatia bacterium]